MTPPIDTTPTSPQWHPNRRELLALAGVGTTGAALSSCDILSTDPSGSDGNGDSDGNTEDKEAPELAQAVQDGDLPPVEERLPDEPLVLEPAEELGTYGGELTYTMLREQIGNDWLNTSIGYENLMRWKPDTVELTPEQVMPNVARSVEASSDGSEYTFVLRQGMKWSDGEPFTAEDIVFWFEDIVSNQELSPDGIAFWLDTGGDEPLVVEKVDDVTAVFRFSAPNGLFLVNVASQRGTDMVRFPAHYLKQFHADYADDVEQRVEESGEEDWVALFDTMANRASEGALWDNPDIPVLNAWIPTSAAGEEAQPVVAERNPYYWKTDSEGRQLPYIDRVRVQTVEEQEQAVLNISNGEIDLVARDFNQLRNKPVFGRSRDEGGYEFFETIPQQMNQMIIMVNLTHQNQQLREIFSNRDFRVGLSHALNRQEIIDTVFQRQGEPWQAAPRPESPYYHEELAKQYTEYDPDLANEYLDRVLPDTNSDGIRLMPDGDPLRFQVEVATSQPDLIDALEFVRDQWREVGINVGIQTSDQNLFFERMEANEHDAAVWVGGGGLGATLDPFYYLPYNFNTRYAMPWYFWFVDPDDERAEEPPDEPKRQIELYRQLLETPDQDEQIQLMQEIMEIAVEQFYCMGVAMREREYGIVSSDLVNVPDVSVTGFLNAYLMPSNPQQYFFASG